MPRLKRERPLLLGSVLDEKVKHFLLKLRKKGGVVNTVVAVATTKALIGRSSDEHLKLLILSQQHGQRVCLSGWDFENAEPLLQNQKIQTWLNEKQNYFYNIKLQI